MVNFALIGTGGMAATMMAAFQDAKAAQVIAVFSQSQARANAFAEQFAIANAYDNLEALRGNSDIQAVYIANSTKLHAATAVQALKAGKAVLCEKPATTTPEEFAAIEAATIETGELFMEGVWTLLLPAYRALADKLQQGTIGEAKHLNASFGYPVAEATMPQLFKAEGGGVILDRAVYLLALSLHLFGEIKQADCQVIKNAAGIDTQCQLQLSHVNGVQASLTASLDALLANDITVAGSQGSIHLPPPSLGAEVIKTNWAHVNTGPRSDQMQTDGGLGKKLKRLPLLREIKATKERLSGQFLSYGSNQYLPQLIHFCELVEQQQTESPVVSLALSKQISHWTQQIKNRSA